MKSVQLLWFIFLIFQLGVIRVQSEDEQFPNLYSPQEKAALQKFRLLVKDAIKKHEYMQTDEYLISWLRAKNMDQAKAAEMMYKSLEWRKQKRMDHILKEQYPLIEKNYPYLDNIADRAGRQVIVFPIGAWDVRKVVVSGHSDEFVRFMEQLFEKGFNKIRRNYGENNPKRNITQMTSIYDLTGYNIRQHACTGCIPIYINMIQNYENYYPRSVHKIIGINTPPVFNTLLEILKPFMTEHTRNALHFYGYNKKEWQQILLNEIAPEELPIQFGGTKKFEHY